MALFGRPSEQDNARAAAWGDWARARHPLAIASLVLGIFSLIEFGALPIFSVAGLVLGGMALRQLAARAGNPTAPRLGHRLAWTGLALSAASLALGAVLLLHRHPF
jgi:hypothetical protein